MSAGAESARSTTACQAEQSLPEGRSSLVVERVEDAVALGDVEVRLLRGHRTQARAEQARRQARCSPARQTLVPLGTTGRPSPCVSLGRYAAYFALAGGSRPRCTARNRDRYLHADGRPDFCQVHVLQDRPRLAPPRRRSAGRGQARVPGRLRGLRHRPLAARLLNHRHAGRRRHRPAQPEPEPRGPPHLPRRPRPERPGEMGGDALLVPLDDEEVPLLGGGRAARDLRLRPQVPVPLSDGQAAALVRPSRRGADADHEKPHRGRPSLSGDLDQHLVLLRPRRPGVRRRLRGRRPR